MSNETGNNPTRTNFLTDLANEARRLDSTRRITSALKTVHIKGAAGTVDDPLTNALDVIGLNEYIGWYTGNPEDANAMRWEIRQKPVIMSEFGAEAKFGNHGPDNQHWTEEQQANVYNHQLVMFRNIPNFEVSHPGS